MMKLLKLDTVEGVAEKEKNKCKYMPTACSN